MNTPAATPVVLVVAASRNDVIGVDNKLPWHLPGDLKHFKAVTLGKPIIMGRKTFESIGRPLPGRLNIVVSRDRDYASSHPAANGVIMAHDIDAALTLAQQAARESGAAEIAVIGGADIYRQTLPRATAVYLTRVELEIDGDAHFPSLDPACWQRVAVEPGAEGEIGYRIERWQRLQGAVTE